MEPRKVLLSTPDYPPKIGGLTTFTLNIENALKELNIPYEIFHWKSLKDISKFKMGLEGYHTIINTHYMFGFLLYKRFYKDYRFINFVHGSEVTFKSPNKIKSFLKKMARGQILSYFESSYVNVYVSEFTQDLILNKGLKLDYSRDIVLHNCIDTSPGEQHFSSIDDDTIIFCSFSRNVPHKNLKGGLKLCEYFYELTKKEIILYTTDEIPAKSKKVKVISCKGFSNKDRDIVYQNSHFNLLLSLDHSKKGFVEGFGLTVLEAGIFGTPSIVLSTGGLPESVHQLKTGIVLENINFKNIRKLFKNFGQKEYLQMSESCYFHSIYSHDRDLYKRFLKPVLLGR